MPRCLTTWHYTDHMLEQLSEEILRLYETGEISHGFFTISSLYEQAASRGFPCTHITLLPENIREGLNRILVLTENRKKTENMALTMILDYAGKGGPDYNEREYREATLKKLLVDYKREKQLSGLSIESSNGRLELNLSAPCDPRRALAAAPGLSGENPGSLSGSPERRHRHRTAALFGPR